MTIGKRLIEFRKSKGMTQIDFAKTINMSGAAYKNYELDQRKVPVPVLNALFESHKIDLQWLITGKKDTPSQEILNALEEVHLSVRKYLEERDIRISNEKEAKLVRIIYENCLKYGDLNQQQFENMIELAVL